MHAEMLPNGRTLHPYSQYFGRLFHYTQMDLEYAFFLMYYLCVNPWRVYRTTSWHKQTKNQWARDDPGFVAVTMVFMAVSSLSFAVAFKEDSFLDLLQIMFSTILIDFLAVGVVVATACWFLSNRYLRVQGIHSVEQKVEWLYAFDVHCNSFFPFFLAIYVLQFYLIPILLSPSFLAVLLSNTLYAFAFVNYFHITFLGYNALPFLQNTVVFLYPVGGIALAFCISLILGFNVAQFAMWAYFAK
eukprot:TRINITY_DN2618_c0_g1_i1.p1 TRINITY_DN2618_c0_g1~~TRINITY_DN2618_c0_g1_i1.p1  ORF type:complete len:244 (-),score=54.96 TRINITY_DN2618_c0_g1_i1:37-768(-)